MNILRTLIGFGFAFFGAILLQSIILILIQPNFKLNNFEISIIPFLIAIYLAKKVYDEKHYTNSIKLPKINPININFSNKIFRMLIIISFFWIIIWFLGIEAYGYKKFYFGSGKMYFFLLVGLLPPALFWSYYWIKSAKD